MAVKKTARKRSTPRKRASTKAGALFGDDAELAPIETRGLHEEMEASFLDYSMSVIIARALPDVRDGLKPVHRRILWSMYAAGHRPEKAHVKSARVIGDCMGKFHPHGDASLYDTLVRMTQRFSMSVPLIDGHGNFGSPADGPAASRYCVVGDTRVRTPNGEVKIADIVPEAAPDTDTDISLKVYDRHGALVEAEKFFHSGVHPTFKVQTESGREITGTDNHLLLVAAQDENGAPVFKWKTIGQLSAGDYCVIDRKVSPSQSKPTGNDKAIGILAGGLVSEGWASDMRGGFNNTDKEFFDLVLSAWDEEIGGSRYVYDRLLKSGKPTYEIDCQNMQHFSNSIFGEMVGFKSKEKRIPEFIWSGSEERRRWFLKAAFEGDGSVNANKSLAYCSSSYGLLLDVQLMLLSFGVVGRIIWDPSRDTGVVSLSNRRDVKLFRDRVGFLTRKVAELDTVIASHSDAGNGSTSKDTLPFVAEYLRVNRQDGRLSGQSASHWLVKKRIDTQERWERDSDLILGCASTEAATKVRAFTEHGYYFDRVHAIEAAGPAPVYSLRLRSDERAFITNGFVSHNTECRLAKPAMALLADINENTVDFSPNFDASEREPDVLPARFPNLLVNGGQGIAVGMASNIPPHNLGEVIDAAMHLLSNPRASTEDLMEFVKGPDFPTGAEILGEPEALKEVYETGRGRITMRAKTEVSESKTGTEIVFTEIPYQASVEAIESKIAEMVESGKIEGIRSLQNESAGGVTRFVVVLRPGVNTEVVLNNLYKFTPLQQNFGANMIALVNGSPRMLTLKDALQFWLDHQVEVITRRSQFRLDKAQARLHLIEGLLKAIDVLDAVIATIRSSNDRGEARGKLMDKPFKFTELQSNHILDLTLGRLTKIGRDELLVEQEALLKEITELQKILGNRRSLNTVIRHELTAIRDEFAVPRRTGITGQSAEIDLTALVDDEPLSVTFTARGYIKATSTRGRGAKVAKPADGDTIADVFETSALKELVFFTDHGKAYRASGLQVPKDRLTAIQNLFLFEPEERVVAVLHDDKSTEEERYVMLTTTAGLVKKAALSDMGGERRDGAVAVGLPDGEKVLSAFEVFEGDEMIVGSRKGQAIRFSTNEVRPMGRTAAGVRGINLKGDDKAIAGFRATEAEYVFVVSTKGNAKRVKVDEFTLQGRGGAGMRLARVVPSRGEVAAAIALAGTRNSDVIVYGSEGSLTVLPATKAPIQNREGSGSGFADLAGKETVAVLTVASSEIPDEE